MGRTVTGGWPGLAALAGALALAAGAAADGTRAPAALPAAVSSDSLLRAVEEARDAAAAGRHRTAADRYRALAEARPDLGRWLRLSALQQAARAGDTASARPLADALRSDPLVDRDSVALETARALFRAGDTARALDAARGLDGDADPSLWVRWAGPALLAAGDTARARRGYLEAATAPEAPAEAGARLLELDRGARALESMAEADLREGRGARGRELLRRALEAAPADAAPGIALRLVEAELGGGMPARAHETADRWLATGRIAGPLRARLEMEAARSHFRRGLVDVGEVHLRGGREAGAGEPSARSGYLLADLAHDRGDTEEAAARYRATAERYPRTRHGGLARMRLGFLAMEAGDDAGAAEHFLAYRRHQPDGDWGSASLYWEGRARSEAGAAERGSDLLRGALRRDPAGYYGVLAARRLEEDPWSRVLREARRTAGSAPRVASTGPAPVGPAARGGAPAGAADDEGPGRRGARPPGDAGPEAGAAGPGGSAGPEPLQEMLDRMDALRSLGWEGRAGRELEASRDEARAAAGGPLPLARALNDAGWTSAGIGLAWEAFDRARGDWSRELLEAVFPLGHREAVVDAAEDQGISPALVAAVARQESAFDPRAVSPAGAVGLMQLMPATAAQLARASRRPPPDEEALTDPELSLELGARYLADLLARFDGSRPAALISYNAGPRRYLRWRRYPEFEGDRELMVERIPYAETRRYVKAVLRNVDLYRRLYGLDDGAGASG